jgi:hypothetical protein
MAVSQHDSRSDADDSPSAPHTAHPSSSTHPHLHDSTPRGRIAALLGVLVVVVVVAAGVTLPTGAPAHQLWTSATGTLTQAPADPQVAIQAVIQQANTEQSQALASGNPLLMSDTATAAYYRQLVQLNQGLAAQGATAIELTQLNWGPVTVNGTTATAMTTETWLTIFNDGTTTESTDSNVYTLVQQGGTWLIEADQNQPPAAAAQPTPGVSAPTPVPAQPTPQAPLPAVGVGANTSHNWSGYAATSGRFTSVTGTWTVPQPRVTGAPGVGATWVGIGGVTSNDLIQAGTQDVSAGGGQAQFQTWIEMLPQASQQVPLAVEPGDSITVSITEQGAGTGAWQISMTNNSSGQTYQTSVNYASSESSAEWIEEAPSGSSGVLPLDQFNSVSFSAASATLNGQTVDLTQANAQAITMLNGSNQPLAIPSGIASDGSSFSVARTSAPAIPANGGGRGRRPGSPTPSATPPAL